MPDTTTTVLELTKPEVGASTDTWGPKLNTNLDIIDGLFTDPAKKMLKLANGGTGADTAAAARTNLGLGTLATLSSVTATQLASDAVTTAKILDSNVTTAKIANNAVTSDKIANDSITSDKIATGAVGTNEIADGSVGASELANDAVTTVKILDGNVTLAKLAAAVQAFLIPTGSVSAYVGTSAPTGWLLCSGATIGSASSGATARANADTQTLYELLWNAIGNTELPIQNSSGVPTTRGASAASDFGDNKRLPLPDLRGRVIAGQDDMGGTSADRLTGLTGGLNGDTMGATGGAESHVLTVAQLASHYHFTIADVRNTSSGDVLAGEQVAQENDTGGSATYRLDGTSTEANRGDSSNTGNNEAHNNVQPTLILNYIIKY